MVVVASCCSQTDADQCRAGTAAVVVVAGVDRFLLALVEVRSETAAVGDKVRLHLDGEVEVACLAAAVGGGTSRTAWVTARACWPDRQRHTAASVLRSPASSSADVVAAACTWAQKPCRNSAHHYYH